MSATRGVLELHRASYARNPFGARIAVVMALDFACLLVAAFAARYLADAPISNATFAIATSVLAVGTFLVLQATGAYDLVTIRSAPKTHVALILGMGIGFAAALVCYFLVPLPESKEALLHAAAVFLPLFVLERKAFRSVSRRMRNRILLVGMSDLAVSLVRAIETRRDLGLEVVGALSGNDVQDVSTLSRVEVVEGIPVLGSVHAVEKVMSQGLADWVVVASKRRDEDLPDDQLLSLKLHGVPIFSAVSLYERITGEVYHRTLRSSVLIFDDRLGMTLFERGLKRAFDVVVALTALVIAAPILLAAAIAIRLDSKGPIFFRQSRAGRFLKPFQIFKLRTMVDGAERESGAVFASREDMRITRVGHLLRRTRIDELPQFLNVLIGDMSVVGPRPERFEFLDEISERFPYFRVRSAFKPGVTGWAQVRNGYVADIDGFDQKLAHDLYYMRNWSLSMDLSIMWTTVRTVFSLRGV
jgi:exopolysaccharide biosynthesis polyprenyl glycosylphosphotransferase